VETSISKSKIDQLGDRLRKDNITQDDLRLLDEYRRSFNNAYEVVVGTIRQQLGLEPTGRPAKSTTSITEKLQRESIRLSQMQDISGCRLVVSGIAEQEQVVASIVEIFPGSLVVDRREKPSHGYRAVHVIALMDSRSVEIQIRTALQQLWAELSEKLADLVDPAIKYGGGEEHFKQLLATGSEGIAEHESRESQVLDMQRSVSTMLSTAGLAEEIRSHIINLQERIASHQAELEAHREKGIELFRETVQVIEENFRSS
jgi:ppGpp synthetase/RelA/SpoT-type nucleotidyltranferase